MSWTSSESLIYVQFTSCVYGVNELIVALMIMITIFWMSTKTADLVTFTEKNLNENLHFLFSVNVSDHSRVSSVRLDTEKKTLNDDVNKYDGTANKNSILRTFIWRIHKHTLAFVVTTNNKVLMSVSKKKLKRCILDLVKHLWWGFLWK